MPRLRTGPRAADRAPEILRRLAAAHPDAHCELAHRSAYELLVATILSAQTTDVRVNQVTPALFARFGDVRALARAEVEEVYPFIRSIGMYRQKARSIVTAARQIVESHGGELPRTMEGLVGLRGVGRKTANVVLGVAFGEPAGIVVDTHVARLAQRLGLSKHDDPVHIERDLMALFARKEWILLGHRLIFHGRRVCGARSPKCSACTLTELCPSAFSFDRKKGKKKKGRRGRR